MKVSEGGSAGVLGLVSNLARSLSGKKEGGR